MSDIVTSRVSCMFVKQLNEQRTLFFDRLREIRLFAWFESVKRTKQSVRVLFNDDPNIWEMDDPFSFLDGLNMPLDLPAEDSIRVGVFDSASFAFNTEGFAGLLDSTRVARKSQTPLPIVADWSHLLAEAPLLLRYYKSGGNGSILAKQSFWRSFVLPSALRTFGELTVFGKASDLLSSIFYSTTANSAFAMQSSDSALPDDSQWYIIEKPPRTQLDTACSTPFNHLNPTAGSFSRQLYLLP
jgi:hypothetical protein